MNIVLPAQGVEVKNTDQSGEKQPLLGRCGAQPCPPSMLTLGSVKLHSWHTWGRRNLGKPLQKELESSAKEKKNLLCVIFFFSLEVPGGMGLCPHEEMVWSCGVGWELSDASTPYSRAVCSQENPKG